MHLPSCREALQTDLRLLFCNLDTAPQLRRKSPKSDCRLTSSLFFFSTDTSSLCLKKRASGVSEYRVKSTEITGTLKQWMCEMCEDAEKQSGCRPVDVRNVEGRRASQNEGACGTGMSKAQENWIGRNFVSIDVQLISCLNIDYGIRQWKTFNIIGNDDSMNAASLDYRTRLGIGGITRLAAESARLCRMSHQTETRFGGCG